MAREKNELIASSFSNIYAAVMLAMTKDVGSVKKIELFSSEKEAKEETKKKGVKSRHRVIIFRVWDGKISCEYIGVNQDTAPEVVDANELLYDNITAYSFRLLEYTKRMSKRLGDKLPR